MVSVTAGEDEAKRERLPYRTRHFSKIPIRQSCPSTVADSCKNAQLSVKTHLNSKGTMTIHLFHHTVGLYK